MSKDILSIVIPCYNEEKNIPVFFPELLKFCNEHSYQVIVVNDGSSDNTKIELEKFASYENFTILTHKQNRGYGAALKYGLTMVKTNFAITIDSDGQHRLEDVKKIYDDMISSDADLIVGSRPQNSSSAYRTLGKQLIRLFALSLFKLPVQDLNSGMKCYRMAEARQYFDLCPDTMAFSDIILLIMVNDRKKVMEIPITVNERIAGVSTIGVHTAIDTIAEITNLAMLLRPLTIFFRIGFVLLLVGLAWGIFTYVKSNTVTATSTLFLIFGGICFLLGLLGEQLAKLRRSVARISCKFED